MWLGRRLRPNHISLMIEDRELIEDMEEAAERDDDNHRGRRPGGPGG